MEAFIASAALAALGGLTWLAYQHPKEFGPLCLVSGWLFFLAAAAVLLWNSAITHAGVNAIHAAPNDFEAVTKAVTDAMIGTQYIYIVGIVLPAYMVFLWAFVTKLKHGGKRSHDDPKAGK